MKTLNAPWRIAAIKNFPVALLLLPLAPAALHAQLVPDGGTTNITTAIVLPGNLTVGTNGGNTTLNILGPGGAVSNSNSYIGLNASSSSNRITVQNSGAYLIQSQSLVVGSSGSVNQLVVSNGAVVANIAGYLGAQSSSSNNTATVIGSGSLWRTSDELMVGDFGNGNQLIVSNGAVAANRLWVGRMGSGNGLLVSGGTVIVTNGSFVGGFVTSSNNQVVVTGPGSLWTNVSFLSLGIEGNTSQLVVSNGGTVTATLVSVGLVSSSGNNRLTVDGGTLRARVGFEVRRGTNVLNAGLIEAGTLTLGSGNGKFEFNGGTLTATNSSVNNGLPFLVGNGSSAATNQLLGNGPHIFGQGLVVTNNAWLIGNGNIAATLTVHPGGSVAPGNPIGRLLLGFPPELNGTLFMEISKPNALTLTNDQIELDNPPLTYGGALTVTHLGPTPLAAGDVASLFMSTSYGGAFTSISLPALGPGLMWTNRLLVDGSLAVVTSTPPSLSGATLSGTNLLFNVTGGSPGGAFTVLTSTNVALPRSSWTTNSIGNFDWLGNVTLTNVIHPSTPQRYFTLRVP